MKIQSRFFFLSEYFSECLDVAYLLLSRALRWGVVNLGSKYRPILGVYLECQFDSNGNSLTAKTLLIVRRVWKFGLPLYCVIEGVNFDTVTGKFNRSFKSKPITVHRIDPHGIGYTDTSRENGRRLVGRGVIKFRVRSGGKFHAARGFFRIPVRNSAGKVRSKRTEVSWRRLSSEDLEGRVLERFGLDSQENLASFVADARRHCD